MKFGIWTPLPESAPHAGVKALWRLGHELAQRGHEITMWSEGRQPSCDVLIVPERTAPKTRHPRTVRWQLLHGGRNILTDRVYTWSMAYAVAPLLQVPYFTLDEFPTNLDRSGTAVWVGKGNGQIPASARMIDYTTPRTDLIHILATSTYLLSFDAFSAVNTEATLCGTPVQLPMNRPTEMPQGDDSGFRWNNQDNTHLLPQARPRIENVNAEAHQSIDSFTEDMRSWMSQSS